MVREAFKKNNDETYGKFHILGGGGQQGVIFLMLSRKILNAQKAILSIFRHFYFFPRPPGHDSTVVSKYNHSHNVINTISIMSMNSSQSFICRLTIMIQDLLNIISRYNENTLI